MQCSSLIIILVWRIKKQVGRMGRPEMIFPFFWIEICFPISLQTKLALAWLPPPRRKKE
jgi:hypothetical protein